MTGGTPRRRRRPDAGRRREGGENHAANAGLQLLKGELRRAGLLPTRPRLLLARLLKGGDLHFITPESFTLRLVPAAPACRWRRATTHWRSWPSADSCGAYSSSSRSSFTIPTPAITRTSISRIPQSCTIFRASGLPSRKVCWAICRPTGSTSSSGSAARRQRIERDGITEAVPRRIARTRGPMTGSCSWVHGYGYYPYCYYCY
jgi:hypothetical protein